MRGLPFVSNGVLLWKAVRMRKFSCQVGSINENRRNLIYRTLRNVKLILEPA